MFQAQSGNRVLDFVSNSALRKPITTNSTNITQVARDLLSRMTVVKQVCFRQTLSHYFSSNKGEEYQRWFLGTQIKHLKLAEKTVHNHINILLIVLTDQKTIFFSRGANHSYSLLNYYYHTEISEIWIDSNDKGLCCLRSDTKQTSLYIMFPSQKIMNLWVEFTRFIAVTVMFKFRFR